MSMEQGEIENLRLQLRIAAQSEVEARMLRRAAEQTRSFLATKHRVDPLTSIIDDSGAIVPREPSELEEREERESVAHV